MIAQSGFFSSKSKVLESAICTCCATLLTIPIFPAFRQEMLEQLIQKYLTATNASPPTEGVVAEPSYPGSNLSLAMLDEALLAGLGPKRRKQNLRKMKERNRKLQGKPLRYG